MSNRIFQSVVLQMKEGTDRVIGVIDAEGTVVACDELSLVGEHWAGVVESINAADSGFVQYEDLRVIQKCLSNSQPADHAAGKGLDLLLLFSLQPHKSEHFLDFFLCKVFGDRFAGGQIFQISFCGKIRIKSKVLGQVTQKKTVFPVQHADFRSIAADFP